MNFESLKQEFIQVKKEQFDYMDSIARISSQKQLTESEKLEFYRTLHKKQEKVNQVYQKLRKAAMKETPTTLENIEEIVVVTIDLDPDFLSTASFYDEREKSYKLKRNRIHPETFQYQLTLYDLWYDCNDFVDMPYQTLFHDQELIEDPIYIYCGNYDYSEDCYGPLIGDPEDYIYGVYTNYFSNANEEIKKKEIPEFEKDKIILHAKPNVREGEIRRLFEKELLNPQNPTIQDCISKTRDKIDELNWIRSPEYKEGVLLDRIQSLYQKVKGKCIEKEILYKGNFIEIFREAYQLPNQKVIQKEKIARNHGKNSVIIIPITQEKKYIVTFQNRIPDKMIAEFPSGYIEEGESPIDAAKRELLEETGYMSDDLFVLDTAYTSPGVDNSTTYIVVANCYRKTDEKKDSDTEFLLYDLFSELELQYLIQENIMSGSMNKLAYYSLVNNTDDCHIIYCDKKVYKMLKKKQDLRL